MKQLIIPAILLLFITSFNLNTQWVQVTNGMGDRDVRALGANINSLFAGTLYNGIYRTDNNGENWIQIITSGSVYSIAANSESVYAGTEFGLIKSSNNGINWTGTSVTRSVYSLSINGNYIFAGTYTIPHPGNYPAGVYRSTDNGSTWAQTSLNNRNIYALAFIGNNIFAGAGDGYGIYLSVNNGTSWSQTSLNNLTILSLIVNGNYIFAGTSGNGIYFSTNLGSTWIQTSLNAGSVNALAAGGNNIFAGFLSTNGVYVSTDNGISWTQRNEGLGNNTIYELCILNNYIYAGTWRVYRRPLSELTGIQPISNEIPNHYSLLQNYPNPFNPTTKIKFEIPNPKSLKAGETNSKTEIRIYDIQGKMIEVLVNEIIKPGTYEIEWNAFKYSSGVYFYRLASGNYVNAKKMLLVK